ncbi:hypothetical protein AH04_161 [Erwinia phage AH04]|uniref:Uncharacterized protein n=1 Tax=Erwinia phage AH04 TaxID=2869569 RepID=A0AAE8BQD0_9CAUD|nr:hypothetical protein PQC02_gp153 [Erwinia phage AH04]QZA70636.1 hypothetical protein AH04_161 [Erwinia phage AH04]
MAKNFITGELIKVLSLVITSSVNAEQYRNYEPETVAGNSRQKRIMGGKHSWPEAKRKGKR